MTDLSDFLLIDTNSATVLNPQYCVLVHDSALSKEEWDELDNFSDSEICDLGIERGRPLAVDSQALDAVAALLNAEQWSSDHLDAVAELVRSTGRTISDYPSAPAQAD